MPNWSEIPDHIIDLFVKHMPPYAEDFYRFSAVCKPWRSVALERKGTRFGPWLMLPEKDSDNNSSDECGFSSFYSISSNRLFHLELPPSRGKRCWGSPYGWLVTIGLDLNIHLLNPLTASQLSLPSLHTFPPDSDDLELYVFSNCTPFYPKPARGCDKFIHKLVLSSDPCCWTTPPNRAASDQCCMAIYGRYELAFAFPGDEAWTAIDTGSYASNADVIVYRGHIYVVTVGGILMICEDINTPHPKATCMVKRPPRVGLSSFSRDNRYYLVEMFGVLHLVYRFDEHLNASLSTKCDVYRFVELLIASLSTKFEVYRFDFYNMMWTRVSDFGGDHALFLGLNASFAISTYDYPEFKGNCIYFTDDRFGSYGFNTCRMGVFDYVKGTVEPFYTGNGTISKLSRPLFFMPTM